jgi:hypothetical protein
MCDLTGAMRKLNNCGKAIQPVESLSSDWVQVIYTENTGEEPNVISTGGFYGRNIAGWNKWTFRRIYNFIYHIEEEQDESEKKKGFNSIHDCPKLFRILYQLRHNESAQEHYRFILVGYNDSSSFEKTFYCYLIPKDPYSEYGDFFKMVAWLNNNIIEQTNIYDEYEILKNNGKVTVTLKISCNGFKPVRSDGKKELKAEIQSPNSGLEWKYMFYDEDWQRYGSFKHKSFISNGATEAMQGNTQFREDLRNGLFGELAAKTADEETSWTNYKLK